MTALFYKLFIEKMDIETVTKELLEAYGLNQDNGGEIVHDINEFYMKYQNVEYLSHYLEPYD